MLLWIIVLFIISLISGFFAFGGFSLATALLAKIVFLTFLVLFLTALFVFLGTKYITKK